ncbi:MAG: hypothetical protein H6719_02635 [Sandaracinaceae bacterium]|nr:hypothetical protein [Sandaracinaceae bacterium]
MRAGLTVLAVALLLSGCCVNPFRNTRTSERGRPGDPEVEARRSMAPAQPAVQPASAASDDPGAGFDIRLVRVQPGVHLNTEQPCDVIFTTGPEAVAAADADRYTIRAAHRMPVQCHAPSGDGWADLLFSPENAAQVANVRRGSRIRVRILTADGGYVDYPTVQFVAVEGQNPELARTPPHAQPAAVPNGFDLRLANDDPGLIGTVQQCAVAHADEIQLMQPTDQRPRNYPAGIQNRMTVACKHQGGEELADLVFMPAQALAALEVRRGGVVPVRIISRDGGFVEYPILQFAGQ